MDVTSVLQATLSPNFQIRSEAEAQLNAAANQDFQEYLRILVDELAKDSPSDVRRAAGLAVKNALAPRDPEVVAKVRASWLQQIPEDVKNGIKNATFLTLSANDFMVGQIAGQVIAAIAAIELVQNQWQDLMPALVKLVSEGSDFQKQAAVTTIGYICASEDPNLRLVLEQYANAILTAVVQGARKDEPNNRIRNAAINALVDAMEFVKKNFENEGERNFIMQVVCEATQASDSSVQQGAWGCLITIMGLYYDKMRFYMEQALVGLTLQGMKSEDEDVAKLAIEFWCTICEQEIAIDEDNRIATNENSVDLRPSLNFAKLAVPTIVPELLILMTKQDEDVADDEINSSKAAYQCLQLWAVAAQDFILETVVLFVNANLSSPDWHLQNASIEAFGAILDGPNEVIVGPIAKEILPKILHIMQETPTQSGPHVALLKDSAAYALGRVCEFTPKVIDSSENLHSVITALFESLTLYPKTANSCCWALTNLADQFYDPDANENALTPYFQKAVAQLLTLTEAKEFEHNIRTAAYEVLRKFVDSAALNSLPLIAELATVILQRLDKTKEWASQVASVEDRMTLEEMQSSLCSLLAVMIQRLDAQIAPFADGIMQLCLELLNTLPAKSVVPEGIFAIVGALATAIKGDFIKYMPAFVPFLCKALAKHEEPALCSISIGLISDLTTALDGDIQPFCDQLMHHLLPCLRSSTLGQQFTPAIIQTFGAIAMAIKGAFMAYSSVIIDQVLVQAAGVKLAPTAPYEQQEYVVSLREGVVDAYDGIVLAMIDSNQHEHLRDVIVKVSELLHLVSQEPARSEALCKTCMGIIGDISTASPRGELIEFFNQEWLINFVKEVKTTKDFSEKTIALGRWANHRIKEQKMLAGQQHQQQQS